MKDVRPIVFVIGVACLLAAIATRFLVRDIPTVPKPATFLEFANTCFLLVVVLVLVEILEAAGKHFALARKVAKANLELAAQPEPEEPAEES